MSILFTVRNRKDLFGFLGSSVSGERFTLSPNYSSCSKSRYFYRSWSKSITAWRSGNHNIDPTSGGLVAAPIVFDDNLILAPIIHGDLFPIVSVLSTNRNNHED
jgi:hypothetical protein